MSRYIKSFRLFFGRMPLRPLAVFGAAMAVFSVLIAIPDLADGENFLAGMVEGMSVMIGTVASMVGVMLMIGLYNICSPETPGTNTSAAYLTAWDICGAVSWRRACFHW